jgi:hypothetical protein
MPKIKWNITWGIIVTIAFFILLAFRVEFFQEKTPIVVLDQARIAHHPDESWMNIYQNKKKIGFVRRTFISREKGYHFDENVFMQINTLGVPQALSISTQGDLNPDMTVSSFNFDLNSSLFRFNAHGSVINNKLILFTGLPGAQQKSEIPLPSIPHMSDGIYDAAFQAHLGKNTTGDFNIFDPSTLTMRSVKVTRNADEIVTIMGKRILTQKYCADFMGAKNCAWLGGNGETLKESSILGLSLEKVSREKAQEGLAGDNSIDFTQIASIPVNTKIAEPDKLSTIKIKISGISGLHLALNGERQIFRQGILTITRESLAARQSSEFYSTTDTAAFLLPTALVQAGHPQMKTQIDKIVKPSDSSEQKIRKIVNWVYRNVEKKPVLSVPNALEVLKNKEGDCNEHAVLTAALLRTAGIPAQIETGLIYLRGRFYYHAWNSAYMGKWITADAVFNQFPADVTHIRLVRGEGGEQLDLMGVMGKIRLEILSTL